jgi:hypothetical protein
VFRRGKRGGGKGDLLLKQLLDLLFEGWQVVLDN